MKLNASGKAKMRSVESIGPLSKSTPCLFCFGDSESEVEELVMHELFHQVKDGLKLRIPQDR